MGGGTLQIKCDNNVLDFLKHSTQVEEHYKLSVTTTNGFRRNRSRWVEEHYKLSVTTTGSVAEGIELWWRNITN